MRKFGLILFGLVIIGSMLLAACQPAAEAPAAEAPAAEAPAAEAPVEEAPAEEAPVVEESVVDEKMGGTFYWTESAIVQFDPPLINDDASFHVASLVHVFLFRFILDDVGSPTVIPELAKSWDFEEDGKIIVFHLNEGWTFQDGNDIFAEGEGREITADDVVYSIDRMVTLEGTKAPSDLVSGFESVEALDKYTVKLTMKEPDAVLFSGGRGLTSAAILPKEAVEARGGDWGLNPIGGGPFEFIEYVADDHVTLRRNEDFAIPAFLDEVFFRIIPDQDVQMISLEAGEIDRTALPAEEFDRFENDPDYKLYAANCPYSYNIIFDLKNELFQDILVREAIAHAIDGRAIMKNQFGGMAVPGCGIAGPGIPGHDPDLCDLFAFDPALTDELMVQAGWTKNAAGIWEKDGQTFTFDFEVWNMSPMPIIATAATTQMQEAGFDVNLVTVEFGTWIEDALGENTQKPMMSWSGFCGEGGMNSYWGRSGLGRGWGFDDEEIFTMLDQANTMLVDPELRQTTLQEAHRKIYSTYINIPLGFATGYEITTARVEDWAVTMWFAKLVSTVNNVWLSSK